MMGFLFKRALKSNLSSQDVSTPKPDGAPPKAQGQLSRTVAPNCAIWNDIQRALEAK